MSDLNNGAVAPAPAASGRLPPPCIPSRFLEKVIAGRDLQRVTAVLLRSVHECLSVVRHHAKIERDRTEELLLHDMETRGSTRPTHHHIDASSMRRLRDLAVHGGRLEDLVRHWEDVMSRCSTLQDMVEESPRHTKFHATFLELAKRFVDEARRADWQAAPPHEGPWSSLKTFFDDDFIRFGKQSRYTGGTGNTLAKGDTGGSASPAAQGGDESQESGNSVPRSQLSFVFKEAFEWTGMPPSVREKNIVEGNQQGGVQTAAPSSSVRLGISCCCLDDSDPFASLVYIGTERGLIFSVPWDCFYPASETWSHSFKSRDVQAILSKLINMRARMEEDRAGLPKGIHYALQFQRKLEDIVSVEPQVGAEPALLNGSVTSTTTTGLTNVPSRSDVKDSDACAGFMMQEGPVKMFQGFVYGVTALKIIAYHTQEKSKVLVATCIDKSMRLFNAATGAIISIVGPERSVCGGFGYLPGADAIIAGHYDGSVGVWDVQTGVFQTSLIPELGGAGGGKRGGAIHALHVMTSQDASVQRDASATVALRWDDIAPKPPPSAASSAGPSSSPSASSSWTDPIRAGASSVAVTCFIGCRNGHIYGLHLKQPVATAGAGGDRDDASKLAIDTVSHCFLPDGGAKTTPLLPLPETTCVCSGGHTAPVTRFASLARFLFSADSDGRVIKWDLGSGERLFALHGHTDEITAMLVTCDGFLFTSSRDGLWLLWDAEEGHLLKRCGRHYHQVTGLLLAHWPLPTMQQEQSPPGSLASEASVASLQSTTVQSKKVSKGRRKSLKQQNSSQRRGQALPCPPRACRQPLPGGRECIALQCAPSSPNAVTEAPEGVVRHPLCLISFSRDDAAIAWNMELESALPHD